MTVPPLEFNARIVARSDRGVVNMDGFLIIHVAVVVKRDRRQPAPAQRTRSTIYGRSTGATGHTPGNQHARTVERFVTA
jgi:hypothetical protein